MPTRAQIEAKNRGIIVSTWRAAILERMWRPSESQTVFRMNPVTRLTRLAKIRPGPFDGTGDPVVFTARKSMNLRGLLWKVRGSYLGVEVELGHFKRRRSE